MNIKKVQLTNSGFKGMSVEYTEPNLRDGKEGKKLTKDKLDHPIHLGLERPFKDLRFHLLEICEIIHDGMEKKDIDYAIAQCEVTGIKIDGSEFSIIGSKDVFEEKSFKLETPMVSEVDGYEHYASVAILVGKIIEETKLYFRGEVKVSDDELVERWVAADKEKGFNLEAFNNMSAEKKREFCQSVLEKSFGCVVLGAEDMAIEHVSTEEVTAEFKQEIDETEETIVIEMQPEPVKLSK
jgi:hypothetical protein